jgi:general stress protein 26
MEEKEAKQLSLELMKVAEAAYLSTIDSDGFPQTRVMGNLRNTKQYSGLTAIFSEHSDDFLVYLTTSKSSAKMQQIKANPKVSVYFCNFGEFHTLMLAGTIEIVSEASLKKQIWQNGWEVYWPDGAEGKEFAVLRLLPDFAKGWYKEGAFEFKLK